MATVEVVERSRTRVEILKSAAVAFRRLGYHGATVEKIAAVLHMKRGQSLLLLSQQGRDSVRVPINTRSIAFSRSLAEVERRAELAPDEKNPSPSSCFFAPHHSR